MFRLQLATNYSMFLAFFTFKSCKSTYSISAYQLSGDNNFFAFCILFNCFYIFQVGGEPAGGGPGRHCRDILLSHHLLQETSTQLNHLISSVADPDTVRSEPFWSDPVQIKLFGSGSGSDHKV